MAPNYSSSDAQQQNIHCVFILLQDSCSLLCGFWSVLKEKKKRPLWWSDLIGFPAWCVDRQSVCACVCVIKWLKVIIMQMTPGQSHRLHVRASRPDGRALGESGSHSKPLPLSHATTTTAVVSVSVRGVCVSCKSFLLLCK